MVSAEWQKLIDEKRASLDSVIPQEWRVPGNVLAKVSNEATISGLTLLKESNLLNAREQELTEKYDATALLDLLATKQVSSVEVVTAFCKRAAIAQQLINPLAEMFFDDAIEQAKERDGYLACEGKVKGPFHGLPISIKDMINIKGQFANLGYVSYLKKPRASENSVIIDILLDGGAVLYCKTTVPQALFVMEGYSTVCGTTRNAHNLSHTPGGSSSGEGALVGFRGSVLGVGSDIGGSVRAPALCNGVYGFRPSSDRLPYSKQQQFFPPGWPSITCTLGPLAVSARDLTLFFKHVLLAEPWKVDSTSHAIHWRELPPVKTLKIGVWRDDPAFSVYPPVSRILSSAVEKLRKAGHEIVELEAPSIVEAVITSFKSFSLDNNATIFKYLEEGGEDLSPALSVIAQALKGPAATLEDVWAVNASKESYREEWARVWRSHNIDVLLCPGSRNTSVPHGMYGNPVWTVIWNLLDFPAAVIPYLKADKTLDKPVDGFDPEAVHGSPGSVQVVGWRFQDEEVLRATEIIARDLHSQEGKSSVMPRI
ncbi:amidase [Aaosphaeria arxii CBS 175.79]|uniref:amidase n=1 Tax=Aaosphaeria arxii CBS 175.79 TaxID=1450172 RepID=A0A6A5X9R0_9PLEO|nr:amidase [Aaosphaeria arxii CBS 175.79]KAF2009649.1 amidase [Aaosphaeria arxii CBS 175.79]